MQRNQPVKKPVIPEIPTVRIVGHCFQQELPYLLQTIRAEQITIMDALDTFSFGILLRNAPTGRLENSLRTDCSNTNIVLVFTPPPVEPEDAPMNMRIQIRNSPPLLKLPREQVENPAVLADMLWKNAAIQEMGSVSFKSSVPPANKIPVVTSTTFV